MQASTYVLARRPLRFIVTLLVVVMAAFAALGVKASAAQACSSPEFCAWTGTFFTGSQWYLVCPSGVGVTLGFPEAYSAKNNCGGQYIRIGWREGGSTNWKACMHPGGDRPNPGRINAYERVGGC